MYNISYEELFTDLSIQQGRSQNVEKSFAHQRETGTLHLVKNTAESVVFLFCFCSVLLFILQNSKFALPGVMVVIDRVRRNRKIDRIKQWFSSIVPLSNGMEK